MRILAPLVVVLLAVAAWLFLKDEPISPLPDKPEAASNAPPVAPERGPKALPAAPSKPLPPLVLNEPAVQEALRRARERKPVRDPHRNQSQQFVKLPPQLVRQKLAEAARQRAEEAPGAKVRAEDVQRAVAEARAPIVDCYEQALAQNPELGGTLKVEFTLVAQDGVGRLNDAKIVDDEEDGAVNHPFLAMCALGALAKLEFPAPEGEGEVTVKYPFKLSPKAKEDER